MDDLSRTNRARWNALAHAGVEFSQPWLDLTPERAAQHVGGHGVLRDVAGQRVLCLASGGGQDSVAFALLGADVTVLDLSDVQLERDREAAVHHGVRLATMQGDMRDLSALPDGAFDVVWQTYSINFVPNVLPVFRGVARVLRPGGIYFLMLSNPFVQGIDHEKWSGAGYPLEHSYVDGEDLTRYFPHWTLEPPGSVRRELDSPHEFRHALQTVFNALGAQGFTRLGLWEHHRPDDGSAPGSWGHLLRFVPLYLYTYWRLERR